MKILVLGIGQSMRRDDAAGLEAVRLWQNRYPQTDSQVTVEISELPGIALLDSLTGMDAAILVDAVRSSDSVGTVIRIGTDKLVSFASGSATSHGWGIAETLHLGLSLVPSLAECHITLFGIVGRDFNLGTGCSPTVQDAVSIVAGMIENEIQAILN